jgi:hypothetical protein
VGPLGNPLSKQGEAGQTCHRLAGVGRFGGTRAADADSARENSVLGDSPRRPFYGAITNHPISAARTILMMAATTTGAETDQDCEKLDLLNTADSEIRHTGRERE